MQLPAPISPRHGAALAYARAGIPVFPCVAGSKRPATPRGFHDATTDEETINGWWSEADYNVAVEPERAGWAVIDIDRPEVPPKLAELAARSHIVRTPRGGWHIYLAGSLPPTAGKLGSGIDTRGHGSYVLMPPSIVEGRPYLGLAEPPAPWDVMPLPDWIAAAVTQDRPVRALAGDVPLDLPDNIERARTRLRHYVGMGDVAIEGQGGDDRTYRLAAEMLNLGLSEAKALDLIAIEWNPHCVPPWDDEELATKVANAAAYMQNEPGSWAVGGNTERMAEAAARYAAEHPAPAPDHGFRSWSWLADRVFPPVEWAWDRRLVLHHPNLYTGRAKVGKTTFALNLAVAIVAGIPFLGRDTRALNVAMLLGEDAYGPVRDNLRRIAAELDADPACLDRIAIRSVLSEPVKAGHLLASIGDDGTVSDTAFMREVVVPFVTRSAEHTLLIVDPLAEFVSFNRYSDHSARALVTRWLNAVCRLGNVTPLLTDHPSLTGVREGRDVGGSQQMEASFPLVATLKAGEWSGVAFRQREMTFEVKFNRFAPEERVSFWRSERSPVLTRDGVAGHRPQDRMERVFRHVLGRLEKNLYCGRTNASDHGPAEIARELAMTERDVAIALSSLTALKWLEYHQRSGGGAGHTPAHYALGPEAPKLAELSEPGEPW